MLPQQDMVQICEAIVQLFDPFAEAVLHDLGSQTISHISGPLSARQVGDASFIEEVDLSHAPGPVFGPYRKTNPDGRQIKSISVVLHDQAGVPSSLLCINLDTSRFEAAHALLSRVISVPSGGQDNPLADDWLDTLNSFVAGWRLENAVGDAALSVENRHRLLAALTERRVFDRPKAADAVARAVGVSRATIYNDLKSLGAGAV